MTGHNFKVNFEHSENDSVGNVWIDVGEVGGGWGEGGLNLMKIEKRMLLLWTSNYLGR